MMPRLNPLFVVAFVSFSSSFPSSHDSKVSWLWVLWYLKANFRCNFSFQISLTGGNSLNTVSLSLDAR
jgi:hypothetical protein